MSSLWSAASLVIGVFGGFLGSMGIAACCPESKDVVWDTAPGTYAIDERFGPQPLHGDMNYQLVISADGNSAVETYVRASKAYRTEYALGPGSESRLRPNTSLADE